MTSNPASRSVRATIFAPRSWPSRPGLATRTRTVMNLLLACAASEHHRLLELAPHRFERGDHFANGAVGVSAVDQLVHQVVIAFRGFRQCGQCVIHGGGITL